MYEPGPKDTDGLWEEVQKRELQPDSRDPRLDEPVFRDGHKGALLWEIVGRLQQLRAVRDAQTAGERLFYSQGVDVPMDNVDHFSRSDAMEALQFMNMTNSGYLMGMCPLFIGLKVRLSANFELPLLSREVTGTVRDIQFHPRKTCIGKSLMRHKGL